jgi:putative transposase
VNGRVLQAYQFALDPADRQLGALYSHCGAQRFAYNWGLRLIKANLDQRDAEKSYGITDSDLTPLVNWSAYGLRKVWNRAKEDDAPWWRENSKEAYSSGLANLAAAMGAWAKSCKAQQNGAAVQFPRFKSKKSRLSCRFTTGSIGLSDVDRRHIRLPRIGLVRTHESTRKLARLIEAGAARIRSAAVSFLHGRWFVSFSVEVDRRTKAAPNTAGVIGVDLGIKSLAVLSEPVDGITDEHGAVENPDHLERALKRLRRLNADIVHVRSNALHQLTTGLTKRFDTVVIEDLNVAGMSKNHRLARRIVGASWGELRRQLTYKSAWRGGRLVVAGRFYPSSKMCSSCGAVKAKLRLSQRTFRCDSCGMSMDRDRNAASNLAALAAQVSDGGTSSQSCGVTLNEPDGNSQKSSLAGSRYGHGKPHAGKVA